MRRIDPLGAYRIYELKHYAGQSDEKSAGGDGTEEIGDGKMNPR
jgi:hypothetical protein